MTENEAIKYLEQHGMIADDVKDISIQAIEEIQQYRAYKEIFEGHFSKEALELLSDKEEFRKWIERGKWIAKKCDEINRKLESFEAIGTVEEFKALKEKSVAKKIRYVHGNYDCNSCGKPAMAVSARKKNYCDFCGQKLDWSE